MDFDAILMKSFGDLPFGASEQETESVLGIPEEKEKLEAIDGSVSVIWHYWSKGFTVFFDRQENGRFCCAEVDSSVRLNMWGQNLFSLNENEIKSLFKENGFNELDEEQHEWGEKRISFDDAMADFYFENGILVSINFGVMSENLNQSIYPN